MSAMQPIFELDEKEQDWWSKKIRNLRNKLVKTPRYYVGLVVTHDRTSKKQIIANISEHISLVREKCWNRYLIDEVEFHKFAIAALIEERKLPKEILDESIVAQFGGFSINVSGEELKTGISDLIGTFAGKIMPYLFYLGKSTSNSRRSRAGQTFEAIVEYVMDTYGFQYQNQSQIGRAFYEQKNLGKMVDIIIPSKEHYVKDRSKCVVVTMKTSLRERWSEVVEELERTKSREIYLLTLDETLSKNVLQTLNEHGIKIVTYHWIATRYPDHVNIISFENFFKHDIPHNLKYWEVHE